MRLRSRPHRFAPRPFVATASSARLGALLLLGAALLAACSRRKEELREWLPSDHDRNDDPSAAGQVDPRAAGQVDPRAAARPSQGTAPPARAAPSAARDAPARDLTGASAAAAVGSIHPPTNDGAANLVEITWRTQCALCHGLGGRGDGPQGPLVHAPDLTRPDWQASTSDAQIGQIISNGKDRMPRFEFPPAVVKGLIERIRSMKGH
jgi:mono/diheme cytochrome c family protein